MVEPLQFIYLLIEKSEKNFMNYFINRQQALCELWREAFMVNNILQKRGCITGQRYLVILYLVKR